MEQRFFDKIVIGHNSFFGVDHLSSERGQKKAAYFSKTENIIEIIDICMKSGASGMMMSTHERSTGVAEALKQRSDLFDQMKLYPLLPYVQKYVVAANEKGMLNVVFDMIKGEDSSGKLELIWNGMKGVLGKDVKSMLSNLIKVELRYFKTFNIPCVFLHDAFTDLLLALDLKDIVEFYYDEIYKQFGAKAAFATKNPVILLEKFHSWGFEHPLIMPHVNKLGFSMNPGREACELALEKYRPHVMAMSTLASGHLKPDEAFSYLGGLGTVESAVVGVSSKNHIDQTFQAMKAYL